MMQRQGKVEKRFPPPTPHRSSASHWNVSLSTAAVSYQGDADVHDGVDELINVHLRPDIFLTSRSLSLSLAGWLAGWLAGSLGVSGRGGGRERTKFTTTDPDFSRDGAPPAPVHLPPPSPTTRSAMVGALTFLFFFPFLFLLTLEIFFFSAPPCQTKVTFLCCESQTAEIVFRDFVAVSPCQHEYRPNNREIVGEIGA